MSQSDLLVFFGSSESWRMADSERVDKADFLKSAGVRLPRLKCGRISL
jgi:hypothetical protein